MQTTAQTTNQDQSLKFGHKNLYIGGDLVPASDNGSFDVICPADETVVGSISWATKADTLNALDAAEVGFQYWSSLSLSERLEWISKLRIKLLENATLLRESIMYEMGKTWEGTEEDLTSITNSLQFYAEAIQDIHPIDIPDKEGSHKHTIVQQPVGVVVAFLAYNFPLLNLGFKLGPALAAGCSIILKPSEFSPLSAYIIGEICEQINFPKGVINIICGDVENVGIPLCESKITKLVTMIGSTETAQKLIAQSSKTSIKRYSMECGGNAPFVVFDDADIPKAVADGSALKFGNTGQICVSPNRYFIHEEVIEDFTSQFVAKAKAVKIGFGKENAPTMGPMTNRQSVEKVKSIVDQAIAEGGELLYGGSPIEGAGYYFEPTVIVLKNPAAAVLQREVFGPIAIIVPFKSEEEVIAYANSTDAGLASYVYAQDEEKLQRLMEAFEFGEVHLNGFKFDIYLPHGGVKNSGISVDCSVYALDDYLIKKRVTQQL
ncbi:aldehyde dehydrogenase family protein [Sediminitomix flava]|uniref:Succinate-semialdehyde dehydrogenase/glutarate-semialdehyde dehydrogenase n=1 Tax=Sediminitomix flava TaxID=379075 RepID=A0A315Z925_SEDFL|nr:aldehyde dehydrogenase family protein [Sediminitomix flava]PWJ41792.1 succinate-semialdehyde dehydrogenase/glutarate-semialdehyde dehydrogenase [Sediminitomix flava]